MAEVIKEALPVTFEFTPVDGEDTVTVTFTDGVVTHVRDVNKAMVNGVYDSVEMTDRVTQVALGVQHKIALGVVTNEDPTQADTTQAVADAAEAAQAAE